MIKKRIPVTIALFSLCAVGIAALAVWPFNNKAPRERHRTRIIIPTHGTGLILGPSHRA